MGSRAVRGALAGALGAFGIALAMAVCAPTTAKAEPSVTEVPLYYLHNDESGEYLFTVDKNERDTLVRDRAADGWSYQWVTLYVPTESVESSHPVYRLFNQFTGEHVYTGMPNEHATLAADAEHGWIDEGAKFYSNDGFGAAMYRIFYLYCDNPVSAHEYSTNLDWARSHTGDGWNFDGDVWWGTRRPVANAEKYQGKWFAGINWPDIDPTNPSDPAPPSSVAPVAPNTGEGRQDVVEYARQWIGTPYVSYGESPSEGGFDCSGLTQWVFRHFGVDLPRTTYDQIQWLKDRGRWTTDPNQLKPGDLIAMSGGGHVAIFVGKDPTTGRYMMIDAPKPGQSVIEREIYSIYWDGTFMGGGSVL